MPWPARTPIGSIGSVGPISPTRVSRWTAWEFPANLTSWEISPDLLGGREHFFRVTASSGMHDSALGEHESALSDLVQGDSRVGGSAESAVECGGSGLVLCGPGTACLALIRIGCVLTAGPRRMWETSLGSLFENLDAGTEYTVEAQAAYGTVRSAWSDPLTVTTASATVTPARDGADECAGVHDGGLGGADMDRGDGRVGVSGAPGHPPGAGPTRRAPRRRRTPSATSRRTPATPSVSRPSRRPAHRTGWR